MRKPRIRLAVIAFIGWTISLYFSNYLLNQDTFIKDRQVYIMSVLFSVYFSVLIAIYFIWLVISILKKKNDIVLTNKNDVE
ncbi:MAG: hypothetical protein CL758_08910 [Chloroflexi bacterium]|nr:hypothetical protein [Chloroflexota bacterium]